MQSIEDRAPPHRGRAELDAQVPDHGTNRRVAIWATRNDLDTVLARIDTLGAEVVLRGSSFDKEAGFITGNLGQLRGTDGDRPSTHTARLLDASLQGEFSLIGRAVVVHERGNDPDITPDGGAGARIACGVIGVANPSTQRTAGR